MPVVSVLDEVGGIRSPRGNRLAPQRRDRPLAGTVVARSRVESRLLRRHPLQAYAKGYGSGRRKPLLREVIQAQALVREHQAGGRTRPQSRRTFLGKVEGRSRRRVIAGQTGGCVASRSHVPLDF